MGEAARLVATPANRDLLTRARILDAAAAAARARPTTLADAVAQVPAANLAGRREVTLSGLRAPPPAGGP